MNANSGIKAADAQVRRIAGAIMRPMNVDVSPEQQHPPRRIRSFVLRAGRITAAQQRALDELWPRYGLDLPEAQPPSAAGEPGRPFALDAVFGRHAPRSLEIGFGNGDNLVGLATAHPERDFIGVEVHRAGVGHLLLGAAAAGLSNLRVICHDAVEVLEHGIAPAALDEVLILFPDPWHKKRHNKRRLIQAALVTKLAARLKPGGYLHCATDWQPYAEQILQVLGEQPLLRNTAAASHPELAGYAPKPHYRPLTKFENRGIKLGHGVWDVVFERV